MYLPGSPFFLTVSRRNFWTRREDSQQSITCSCLRLSSVHVRICTRTGKGEMATIFHLWNYHTEIQRDQGPLPWLILNPAEAGVLWPGIRASDRRSLPGKHIPPSVSLLLLFRFRPQDRPRRCFLCIYGTRFPRRGSTLHPKQGLILWFPLEIIAGR